jgi:hypothetical protein
MGVAAIATLPLYVLSFDWTAALLSTLDSTDGAYRVYSVARYGMTLVIMLPATFCAGTTLPLITRTLLASGTGERAIGAVYGVNTIGSIIGAGVAAGARSAHRIEMGVDRGRLDRHRGRRRAFCLE